MYWHTFVISMQSKAMYCEAASAVVQAYSCTQESRPSRPNAHPRPCTFSALLPAASTATSPSTPVPTCQRRARLRRHRHHHHWRQARGCRRTASSCLHHLPSNPRCRPARFLLPLPLASCPQRRRPRRPQPRKEFLPALLLQQHRLGAGDAAAARQAVVQGHLRQHAVHAHAQMLMCSWR